MEAGKTAEPSTPSEKSTVGPVDWRPDLRGEHFQPTGGSNGAPFSIAIVRPGTPPKTEEEIQKIEQWRQEMEDPPQMLDASENGEEAPPHRDPIEGSTSPQPRKLGMTNSKHWEAWLDPKTGKYPPGMKR